MYRTMGWVCRMFLFRSGNAVVKQPVAAGRPSPSFAVLGSMIARCSWKERQRMNPHYHYCSKTVNVDRVATVGASSGSVQFR